MARSRDLREVDAVAREFGLDRREFGDFIHELKRGGERVSKANGDFTTRRATRIGSIAEARESW